MNRLAPHHQFKHYNAFPQTRQFGIIDVYLDYNESHPEHGIVTKFTFQVTGATSERITTLRPVDNTYRVRAAFAGSLLGCCDGGSRSRIFALRPTQRIHGWKDTPLLEPPKSVNRNYSLVSAATDTGMSQAVTMTQTEIVSQSSRSSRRSTSAAAAASHHRISPVH